MARKHYSSPEAVLAQVISQLERDVPHEISEPEQPDPAAARSIIAALLIKGPLQTLGPIERLARAERVRLIAPEEASVVVLELRAFLRDLVEARDYGGQPLHGISTYKPLAFRASVGRMVSYSVDGDVRDLVILQLLFLLHEVGIGQLRACSAPDCRRLYVKVYRREFCSVQCQKRINTRKQRQQKREQRERRARLRRRKGA